MFSLIEAKNSQIFPIWLPAPNNSSACFSLAGQNSCSAPGSATGSGPGAAIATAAGGTVLAGAAAGSLGSGFRKPNLHATRDGTGDGSKRKGFFFHMMGQCYPAGSQKNWIKKQA